MAQKFKKTIKEDFGAFVQRLKLLPPPQPAPPEAPHALTSLTFAISDVFDVEGCVTGFGHPDWASSHGPASRTSPLVLVLVEGGATCLGKTVVDEMAYGLSGENNHYDSPTNPAAPSRVSGGCSSGAAVAVAADVVDFSLGLDTVGGVRVPAGYCGILGFRSSHGVVSHAGVIPVSSSLDTAGLFAKDPSVLRRAGHVMLQLPYSVKRNPRQITIADDCFELSKIPSDSVVHVVSKSIEKLFGRLVLKHENIEGYLGSKVPSLKAYCASLSKGGDKMPTLRLLANVMKSIQRHEFVQNHGEWINSVKPTLNPIIPAAEFPEGADGAEKEIKNSQAVRKELRLALNSFLKDDGILVIPTVADPPPKLGGKDFLSEDYQCRAFSLLSIASLSGCCQVSMPLGFYEKIPVSISFIAKQSSDSFLLDVVESMYASLQEEADIASKSKLSNSTINPETSAEIAKEKGNQAFKEKQWTKAINLYTEAIRLCGNTATYYSNRAAAYLEIGSFIQAEADCSKAISLDKKNVKAYLCRGRAREMLGYYTDAIEDFKYALVLEPMNKRAALSADRLKKLFL